MTTYQLIRSAIEKKQQITAIYNGHYRELCPHAIGTKNGKEQAMCFRFGGSGSKGPVIHDSTDNWRCIEIAKLRDVAIRDGEWHTAANHSTAQTCIDSIDLEVKR